MNKKILLSSVLLSFVFGVSAANVSLLPVSGGSYTSWTPINSAANYTQVNESSCDGVSTYVYTNSTGVRDSYFVSLSSIPDGAVINSISITPCASKSKISGASAIDVFYSFNGVSSLEEGGYSLSGVKPTQLGATTFSGLNLIKVSSSTLEIGVISSNAKGGVRLSRLSADISYTLNATPTAPTNLRALASSTSMVVLWNDNSTNELGFQLERSLDGVNYSLLGTTTANTTFKYDFTTATNTLYYYRVAAFNALGMSSYSNTATSSRP